VIGRIEGKRTVVVFRYESEISEDILFRMVVLDEVLQGVIGFTHDRIVPAGRFSPVMTGKLPLIVEPFNELKFQNLHTNGLSEFSQFKELAFSANAQREDRSVFGLLPKHIKMWDFISLLANAPDDTFLEVALWTFIDCTDFVTCKSEKAIITLVN
jgi:hypothetical protein